MKWYLFVFETTNLKCEKLWSRASSDRTWFPRSSSVFDSAFMAFSNHLMAFGTLSFLAGAHFYVVLPDFVLEPEQHQVVASAALDF